MNPKDMIQADLAYYRCFARCEEIETPAGVVRRYSDAELPDMYMHNFDGVLGWDVPAAKAYAAAALEEARKTGKEFYNLFCWQMDTEGLARGLAPKAETDDYMYLAAPAKAPQTELNPACRVKKAETPEELKQAAEFEVRAYSKVFGVDFTTRRGPRKGKVFAANPDISLYLCWLNGEVVGGCELYIDKATGLAKVEDFGVISTVRGQGCGTAILHAMMADAEKAGAKGAYLITSRDNTAAQRLYARFGFGEQALRHTSFLFKLLPGKA